MARPSKTTPSRSVSARPGGKGAPKKASGASKKASPPKAAPKKAVAKKAVAAKATPPKPPAKKVSIKAPAKGAPAPKPAAKASSKKAAIPAKSAASAKPAAAAAKPVAPVKAAPAVKAPPPPKPKPKKSNLTPKETEATRQELIAQRATLEKELEDLDAGSLHIAQSELTGDVSFDEESADAGAFTFERERDLSLANNIRDLLDKVEHATRRLNDGTYGICERCGEPIDKLRLKALPYSVLCIKCKQQEERFR